MSVLKKFVEILETIDPVVFIMCVGASLCVSLIGFIGFSPISPNTGLAVGLGVFLPAVVVVTYLAGPQTQKLKDSERRPLDPEE